MSQRVKTFKHSTFWPTFTNDKISS